MKSVRFRSRASEYDGELIGDDVIAASFRSPLHSVKLLAPCSPTKIVCVGRNYADHASEMGNDLPASPLLFFKPPSSVLEPGGSIVYPAESQRVDFEGELAVAIGQRCRNVPAAEARSVIRGYTILNDVTARDLQRTEVQWARAKGFDTFAPIGPCIADDVDPRNLRIRTYLNGELRQDASTASMIFDVPTLVAYVSAAFTLEPGDVIATGTPSGVGPMQPGDEVCVEIEGIGRLINHVVAP